MLIVFDSSHTHSTVFSLPLVPAALQVMPPRTCPVAVAGLKRLGQQYIDGSRRREGCRNRLANSALGTLEAWQTLLACAQVQSHV
jgi:hypothetical protein